MATRAAETAVAVRPPPHRDLPILCHCTTVHSKLKSRSHYMQFMPIAVSGATIRYLSPVNLHGRHNGIDFVALPRRHGWLRHLLAVPSLLVILIKQNAGIYHFQDPELLPVAFLLKLICRKLIVYDCYEDFASMAFSMRNLPASLRRPIASAVAIILRLAALSFDGLMTADPSTLKPLARFGSSHKITFYNFPNLHLFPTPHPSEVKDFDLVYRGGLSERAGVWLLLEALHSLSTQGKRARLLLIGYCDDAKVEAALREKIRTLGLWSSIEIMVRIEHREMARTLSRARVGINPLQDIPKFRTNIPVKIFEYWACGLPVISSDLPPVRPFFKNVRGSYFRQATLRVSNKPLPGSSIIRKPQPGWANAVVPP